MEGSIVPESETFETYRIVTSGWGGRSETDYLSTIVPMVDETRLLRDAELESKRQWKTQRGFVYPAPRKPHDYVVQSNRPSDVLYWRRALLRIESFYVGVLRSGWRAGVLVSDFY